MPITSPSKIDLDVEDFRRLGVRPSECRLTVIRSAAARSARALAEKQLAAPSQQVGLQLSRVATSTYRLLDPRQRRDSNQRMFVGRILPVALVWAGQTSFHNGEVKTSGGVPFGRDSANEASADAETLSFSTELDKRTAWTVSLNDDDLLDTTLLNRRIARARSRWPHPWVLLTIGGLAVGTMLGFARMRTRFNAGAPQLGGAAPVRESLPDHDLLIQPKPIVEPEAARKSAEQATAAPVASPESSTVPSQSSDAISQSERERKTDIHQPGGELESEGTGNGGYLPDPLASLASNDSSPPTARIDRIDPATPDKMEKPTDLATDTDGIRAEVDSSPTVTRHSVPEEASVRAARTQLVSLVPELAHSVSPRDVQQRIAELESLVDTLDKGSAIDWTARLRIAELAWLVEDVSQVSERLKTLIDIFNVPIQQPLSDSFVVACDLASLPKTHQHLFRNGMRLADQLLMSESFAQCKYVVDAVGPSAEFLESEGSVDYLEQFSQAIDQMMRLSRSTQRMIDDSGELYREGGGIGVLGRYYCLMLRQWDVGLHWLAQVSDAPIASVARTEMELGDSSSAEELITLSKRWLVVASRSRGRVSDSMRLHAIDIMHKAEVEASSVQQQELQETMDEALGLLPPFLDAQ